MAHKNWCGKECAACTNPCTLDASIPCSPDCPNLGPNGETNSSECDRCDSQPIPEEIIRLSEKIGEEPERFILRPGKKTENRGWFFNTRVKSVDVPEGYRVYDVRGRDSDPGAFGTLEGTVIVNFAGCFVTKFPVKFPKSHPEWMSIIRGGGYSFA